VLVGDIFDLWIAREHLHDEHHRRVTGALADAARAGLRIDYAVGNRDYAVETWPAHPFDRVAVEVLREPVDAPAWLAEHGDLVNEDDRPYRRWRAFSRSAPVLGLFLALPRIVAGPLSLWLERRMRTSNLQYKRRFPAEHVERRGARLLGESGARFLVLGHFHQELRQPLPAGEALVLPDWKRSRRHLEWDPTRGTMEFVASLPDDSAFGLT
jgi:UDP-2,3-diacylglucosamine pyrophosphatase LpxH